MHEHGNAGLILNVTDEDLGVWVAKQDDPIAFNVAIVDLARDHHFDMNHEVWELDKPMFLNGHATFDMVRDLDLVVNFAVSYLNGLLPDGYYLDIDDGLQLFKEDFSWKPIF